MTDRKADARLQARFSRAIEVFAHEIRTPLTALVAELEQAMERPEGPDQVLRLQRWRLLTEHINSLVTDLQDYSGVRHTLLSPRPSEFCPAELATAVIRMATKAQSGRAQVELVLETMVGRRVIGDRHRIAQVLSNILENAIKYGGTAPIRVHLSSSEGSINPGGDAASCLEFTVVDQGPGMGPEQLKAIFKPRHRGRFANNPELSGQGLGLSITRALLQAIGGRMLVRSQPGQGTAIWFAVPVETLNQPAMPGADRPQCALEGLKILVGEDDPGIRSSLIEMLAAEGAIVIGVSNGMEAERAAAGQAFDLILLDRKMAERDGLSAAANIRSAGGPSSHSIIVMLSADQDECEPTDPVRLAAQLDLWLTKPCRREMLLETIINLSHRQRNPQAE